MLERQKHLSPVDTFSCVEIYYSILCPISYSNICFHKAKPIRYLQWLNNLLMIGYTAIYTDIEMWSADVLNYFLRMRKLKPKDTPKSRENQHENEAYGN